MAEYIEREALLDALYDNEFQTFFPLDEVSGVIDCIPAADVVEIPQGGIGDLSDGYHTFNELYHHRAILFSLICNLFPEKAWKSKLHDTGDMYDGMFIVGIETPQGQATYHYDINLYWDFFKVKELENAPKWDGHTPQEVTERLSTLVADVVEVKHGEWLDNGDRDINGVIKPFAISCSVCGSSAGTSWMRYCPNCGAKMDGKDGAK